jgi:CRP/FNR family transcriptional regulator
MRLSAVALTVRFEKGTEIYSEGNPANAVFNISEGAVKAHKSGPEGSELIMAFLFPGDVFGLARDGRYVNSTNALTPVTAYRIPVVALQREFAADAAIEYQVISKLCGELRQSYDHAFILANKRAVPKLVLFLQMLEDLQATEDGPPKEIELAMSRFDIAQYIGTTLSALSRAFGALAKRGLIEVRDRRHVKVLDRKAFEPWPRKKRSA